MKFKYNLLMIAASFFGFRCDMQSKPSEAKSTASFYELSSPTLAGDTLSFAQFKGKKVLIVNTASKCGFTPQFEDLEKLHKQFKDKVVVIGFPCNQFGSQDPGSNKEIGEFCQVNYGVTFQMMDKVDVKGDHQSAVYKWLTDKKLNGWNDKTPTWNFCKYLIDEKGELVEYYGSTVNPMGKKIIAAIKK